MGSDFEVKELLGSGGYGEVYEAKHLPSGKRVAIKKMKSIFRDPVISKRILREVKVMRMLSHANLVRLYDILEPSNQDNFDTLYLVMDCAPTDLKMILKEGKSLKLQQIQKMLYNLLLGLAFMHSADIIHRDIKPANILVTKDFDVRICDFGLAKCVTPIDSPTNGNSSAGTALTAEVLKALPGCGKDTNKTPSDALSVSASTESSNKSSPVDVEDKKKCLGDIPAPVQKPKLKRRNSLHVQTRWYRAPEVILLDSSYTKAVDIWSVGCVFAEMLTLLNSKTKKVPLFPGTSCYPLSPLKGKKGSGEQDQMSSILDILGTPSDEDMKNLYSDKARMYLKQFAPRKPVDLSKKLPDAPASAIDLLQKMLYFNPDKRLTAFECLLHPFFAGVRDPKREQFAKEAVKMQFEAEPELDIKQLKALFSEELGVCSQRRAKMGAGVYK